MTLYLAWDSETFYSSEYSVSDMGPVLYCADPRFDCYNISVAGSDGFEWSGHPSQAPWEEMRKYDWVASNVGFDRNVLRRLIRDKIAPADIEPAVWHCCANMCVYFGLPRALAKAIYAQYGEVLSKSVRDKDMKGKTYAQIKADPDLHAKILQYASTDPKATLKLWIDHSDGWPQFERELSDHTYRMGDRGVYIDRAGLDADIAILEKACFLNEQRVPWSSDAAILSPKQLALKCREVGIEPPSSLAMTSEECAEWEAKYGSTYPWVGAMRNWRRCNAVLEKYKTIRSRIMPNGRMPYSLLYYGASTGRWSGSGGLNMQNLPRAPFYFDAEYNVVEEKTDISVDLRSKFMAAPGTVLAISDLRQIEPRALSLLAGDREFLQKIREGFGVYEAHARSSMGWTGGPLEKESPTVYLLAKARVLALGYGAGWSKFILMAKTYIGDENVKVMFSVPVSEDQTKDFLEYITKYDKKKVHIKEWPTLDAETRTIWVNAWLQVQNFRKSNPKITALWKRLDTDMKASVGKTYTIGLPSGRELFYFDVTKRGDGVTVATTKGSYHTHAYGALLVENITQAFGRDVFAEGILRLEKAGIPVVFHVHDEVICEVPEGFDTSKVAQLMTENPAWCKSLPIGAKIHSSPVYLK